MKSSKNSLKLSHENKSHTKKSQRPNGKKKPKKAHQA